MLRRVSLLVALTLLLVAYRAPLRQGKGGFMDGLIREQIGELGAAGKYVARTLQDQLLGKRVHYMQGDHSWSGKVTAVRVQPFTTDGDNSAREIDVKVETMAGMGDKITAGEGGGGTTTEQNYGNSATIKLDQISGIMDELSPLIGSRIKVSYGDVRPAILPRSPIDMFLWGDHYSNTIVAVYTDGYVEVDVTGLTLGTNPGTAIASGTVFINIEDIIRDEKLSIVTSLDLETLAGTQASD